MFALHTSLTNRPNGRARLQLETLEGRALPSGFGSLLPGSGQITADLNHIASDLRSLTRQLGTNLGATAQSDLAAIRSDVRTLVRDVLAGKSTASDLATLAAAEAKLVKDLGPTIGGRVSRLLNNLQHDVLALSGDITRPGGREREEDREERGEDRDRDELFQGLNGGLVRTVTGDLLTFGRDLQALTRALGTSVSPTVAGDLAAIRTDIGAVIGDLLTGATTTANDLNTLKTAVTKLATDVGSGASSQVNSLLAALANDVTRLTNDLTPIINPLQTAFNRVQADVTRLEGQLGSNLSSAAQQDVAALDAAITALGADVAAGKAIAGDLTSVLTSEFRLLGDLGGMIPAGARQSFLALSRDLTLLGLV